MDYFRRPGGMNLPFPEQRMAQPDMGMYYLQMANHLRSLDSMQRIYPEAYKRMMPYVDRAIGEIGDPAALTETELGRITHDIIQKSGILEDPPKGHNETTLQDLAGVMLLAALFDGAEFPFMPPVALPFLLPYGNRRRGGFGNIFY